jgi:Cof subfamily protein (haloacid dehalogenase superfamily)
VHFYISDQLYVREISQKTASYAERSGIEPIAVGDLRQTLATPPTKVLALSDHPDLVEELLLTLRQRYATELYLTKSVPTFFEATNPCVDKGTAVRYLAEDLMGLKPAQVMAIGDNWNDVEMIEYAGLGIAMGNAPEEVKALAQWVAPSVEEDGVAVAIAEILG